MNTNEIELEPRQRQAAVLLATGTLSKDVADTVGVTPQTISAWKRNPKFRATVAQLLSQAEVEALDALRAYLPRIVERLGKMIDSPDSSALKAAQLILRITAASRALGKGND